MRRLDGNTLVVRSGALPKAPEVVLLQPSAAVRVWGNSLAAALAEYAEITSGQAPMIRTRPVEAERRLRALIDAAPGVLRFYNALAGMLLVSGRRAEAIAVLEQGLARAPQDAWTDAVDARAQLARAFDADGRQALALIQYQWILNARRAYRDDVVKEAREYVAARGGAAR